MPFTQFTNLDFDEIKVQIKDFLRSNSNFTDFDFEGSNFSVIIDTLAYNTYINAFNANLVANVGVQVNSFPDNNEIEVSVFFEIVGLDAPVQSFSFILEPTR